MDKLAALDPKNMSEAELDQLANDPLIRSLQWQIQNGVKDIKLETNQGEHKLKNMIVPEGMDQGEYLQKMLAENHANEERKKKEEAARKEKVRKEQMAKSDPYYYIVSGAGSPEVDGKYVRDGDAIRNGSRVYKISKDGTTPLANGFMFSHECVNGGEGFILGKAPKAWYAQLSKERLPNETGWSVQEHGKNPPPIFKAVEPAEVVEQEKMEGNTCFSNGAH